MNFRTFLLTNIGTTNNVYRYHQLLRANHYGRWWLQSYWSTVLWASAAMPNRISESDHRPTGLPRLRSTVADYAASACITGVNWLNTSIQSFLYRMDLYLGLVQCFVAPCVGTVVRTVCTKKYIGEWPIMDRWTTVFLPSASSLFSPMGHFLL